MTRLRSIIRKLETNHDPDLTTKQLFFENDDLKPVEKERRKWGWLNYVAFWISDAFNINTWQIASAGVKAGLTWWQVWLTVWLGYFLSSTFIVILGRMGSKYHLPFPVVVRSSFGIVGAAWPILNRVVLAIIWTGVQSWLGGNCVAIMLRSMSLKAPHMHNGIPNSGTTTFDFLSFFLFWLLLCLCVWFPVHKIRHLFTIKSYLVPIAGVAFLIWTLKKAGGIGPIVHQKATISGSEFGWEFVKSTMNCLANFAALIMNNSDFTRFAKRPGCTTWSQFFAIPVAFALTSLIGILVSSASTVMYDETIWSPLDVLNKFLDGSPSAGARTGIWFIAAVFVLAQLGCNIAANTVSAGTDLTALCPRFINIRRGGYVCAVLALVICPWHLLSSSNQFTTYLSSYTIFLSSIAGVMFADYYLVHKGKLLVDDLYTFEKTSAYFYTYGFSWRAYASYVCGLLINVVGFAGSVGAKVPIGATYVYNLNYFGGFIVSGAVYYGLCWWKPIPGCNETFNEKEAEIYFAHEEIEGREEATGEHDHENNLEEAKLQAIESNNSSKFSDTTRPPAAHSNHNDVTQ